MIDTVNQESESDLLVNTDFTDKALKIYETGKTNKIINLQQKYKDENSKCFELEQYILSQERKFGKPFDDSLQQTITQEMGINENEISNYDNIYQIDLEEEE